MRGPALFGSLDGSTGCRRVDPLIEALSHLQLSLRLYLLVLALALALVLTIMDHLEGKEGTVLNRHTRSMSRLLLQLSN
jgi:hypothetical protein